MIYVLLLVVLLLGGTVAVLVIQNLSAFATAVQLSFFVWQTPPFPMGLWLLFSCLFGALVLYMLSMISARQERRELSMLRKRVTELEQAQAKALSAPPQAVPPSIVPMPGIPGPFPPSQRR